VYAEGKRLGMFVKNPDGTELSKIVPHPILNVMSISPDRLWIAALMAVNDGQAGFAEFAIPVKGGGAKRICSGFCVARWAPDGKFFYYLRARATGELRRSFCDGRASGPGFAEDYACLTQGMLDLYETTFEIRWLQWADETQAAMDRLFWDEVNGGYFSSSGKDASVLVRLKEDHDGAEPAPGSVAVLNLLRLGRMLGDEARVRRAERTLLASGDTWYRSAQALPLMLAGLADWLRPPRSIVIAGTPDAPDFVALVREARRKFLPGTVVLAADGASGQAWLAERAAYLREMRPVNGRAAAFVCENFACRLPVTEPSQLAALSG
jgi:hypothetical protein